MLQKKPIPLSLGIILNNLPELVLLIVFCYLQYQHINLDLWNDEIYTLKHFTFTSLHNTLTNYNAPNNHIFFNLINNLYLRLINIDSLHLLMENPYKLRLIPFFYSLCTVFFTYRIGTAFFNRIVALLAVALLISTIPYYNFALQIRGYGLSSLFLVMIVYYALSYSKSLNKKYLNIILIASTLIFYTVPSNIYSIICVLAMCSIFLLISVIKAIRKQRTFELQYVINSKYLHIILAIIFGLSVSLAFYAPIFKDVFMNDYVISGPSFILSNLRFYTTNIFEGMLSNRWIILGVSLLGYLLSFKTYKKWHLSLSIILSICLLPILIVFVRGDYAPLRVFVVNAPFFALFMAVGVWSFWNFLIKNKPIFDLALIGFVLTYSLFTFNKECSEISAHILEDIKEEKRSQDLYYQYYSMHYQPLLDIKKFQKHYNNKPLNVLVHECEGHGIPNYLDKFDIPYFMDHYQPNALDSLLSISDSIYIITNHPSPFSSIKGYKSIMINDKMSYHNVLLFYQDNQLLSSIQPKLDSIASRHKDSINFVFNVYNNSLFDDFSKNNSCYFLSDYNQIDYGGLIHFLNNKTYSCYLDLQNRNSDNISWIIKEGRKVADMKSSLDVASFYVGTKTLEDNYLYFNDFENSDSLKNEGRLIDSEIKFSGLYSEHLDSTHLFSSGPSFSLDKKSDNTILKVSFMASFDVDIRALVIIDINRPEKVKMWQGNKIKHFFNPNTRWQKVITTFHIKENLSPSDEIKIYIWNLEKDEIWIDDFKVELVPF